MTDYHIHIGQWNDVYFKAEDVFYALKKSGIGECWFSNAQEWNFCDPVILNFTEELFSYAEKQNLRILIHTGASGVDSPKRFEHFIKTHPNCLVQLAHLKDLEAQEYMLKKYPNVVVDSSFAGENEIGTLVDDDIERKRILWGTDMPVTYWWCNVRGKGKIPSIGKEMLTEFYKKNHYSAV